MNRPTRSRGDQPEVWSFFTGAMGLDLGLEAVGLHPTLCNELNAHFCRTIRANRPSLDLIEGDISALTGEYLRSRRGSPSEVFLMVGGPPCQPFSSGGKRSALSDPRGNLIYEYLRLIGEVRPRYFVLENVANLSTAALRHRPISERPGKHWNLKRYETRNADDARSSALAPDEMAGSALRQLMQDVGKLAYQVSFRVVDAADYGAPQHRLRFVMLGARDGVAPTMPDPTHGKARLPYVTLRDAIAHLEPAPGAHSIYTDEVRGFFDLIPPGCNWRALPKALQPVALGGSFDAGGGKTGFYRRLSWDAPSPTITGRANRKGSAMCHPDVTRPLSVLECAAIQGFPADWRFLGAMNAQYMQVGNAVPVRLGAAIGGALQRHALENRPPQVELSHDIEDMIAAAIHRLRSAGRNKKALAVAA